MIDLKADSQLAAGLNSPEASKGNCIQRIDSSFQRLNVQKNDVWREDSQQCYGYFTKSKLVNEIRRLRQVAFRMHSNRKTCRFEESMKSFSSNVE